MMDQINSIKKCYLCHKSPVNRSIVLSCNHLVCRKCLSIVLIRHEFKDITYDNIKLNCFCGGSSEITLKQAFSLFFEDKKKLKKCPDHLEVVECYCEDCRIWLCSKCRTAFHDKRMNFHKTVHQPARKPEECKSHNLPLNIYCSQCENELCSKCSDIDSNHVSFHILITDQSSFLKKEIMAQLSMEANEDFLLIIDKAEEEYCNSHKNVYYTNKNKIEALIKSLNSTLVQMKEQYNKELNYSNFLFKMMKYSYTNYFNAINSQTPSLSLLYAISSFKKELIDISIKPNFPNEIDKMLFDMKRLNKKRTIKLNVNFKSLGDDDKDKDNRSKAITIKTCHSEFMSSMCEIEDRIFCTGSVDTLIKIFELKHDEKSLVYKNGFDQHKAGIRVVCNADFGRVLSLSVDNVIKIWQIANGKCLKVIDSAFTNEINDILYIGNDEAIACGDHKEIKIINLIEGSIAKVLTDDSLTDKTHSIRKVLYIFKSETILSGTDDGRLSLWSKSKRIKKVIAHQSGILCLIQLSDERIVTGSEDQTIRIYTLPELNCQFSLASKHTNWITALCQIPTKGLLVSGGRDNNIILWDTSVTPFKYIQTFTGHKNSILFLCPTPENNLLSGSSDTLIKLWKLA